MSWQCRLRRLSMRELDGRPTEGMSAGVYSVNGGDEQARLNFIITRENPQQRTAEIRHIVRKSRDPGEWRKNGLRLLAERHYQDDDAFVNDLTALFNLDSDLASALLDAGRCHLKFAEAGIEHGFDFDVRVLPRDDELFQATYWHNHLFNPSLPGQVQVLAFSPRL